MLHDSHSDNLYTFQDVKYYSILKTVAKTCKKVLNFNNQNLVTKVKRHKSKQLLTSISVGIKTR